MRYTRREVAKTALAALPAASLLFRPLMALAQGKPNSTINGVRVGAITYSYRSMPDQGAEAYLRYVVDSGISQIEFMGDPVEAFAGAPPPAARGGGGRGRGQQPSAADQAVRRRRVIRRSWTVSRSWNFKAQDREAMIEMGLVA